MQLFAHCSSRVGGCGFLQRPGLELRVCLVHLVAARSSLSLSLCLNPPWPRPPALTRRLQAYLPAGWRAPTCSPLRLVRLLARQRPFYFAGCHHSAENLTSVAEKSPKLLVMLSADKRPIQICIPSTLVHLVSRHTELAMVATVQHEHTFCVAVNH